MERQQEIYEHTLALGCPHCKTTPGHLCPRKDGKPFHAARMDKGLNAELKARVVRLRELERLL